MTSVNKTIHSKVPPELRDIFIESNYNVRAVERIRKVNRYYVYQFVHKGIEPTDKTKKGRAARIALFLPEHKKRKGYEVPECVRIWRGLPTEVRQLAIEDFTTWYLKEGNKEKFNARIKRPPR